MQLDTARSEDKASIVSPSPFISWVLVLAVPVFLASAVLLTFPLELPMPVYLYHAFEYVREGRLLDNFEPGGYTLLLGIAARLSQPHSLLGIKVAQGLVSVALCIVFWRLLLRFGANSRLALVSALCLGLHPDLLASHKIWDVPYSTLLLAAIMFFTLRARDKPAPTQAFALGAIFALGCFDRPNFLLLLPICCSVFWESTSQPGLAKARFLSIGAFIASAATLYVCLSFSLYGQFRTPGNGPYNLFAGQNEFSERAMLVYLNAEPSILPALQAAGLSSPQPRSPSLKPVYSSLSLRFARSHPAAEFRLIALKFFTFLRPDTRIHTLWSVRGIVKGLPSIVVPTWTGLVVFVFWRHRNRLIGIDILVICTVVLYVVPFLITNSDPRFRTPLDALVSVHGLGLWARLRRACLLSPPYGAKAVQ